MATPSTLTPAEVPAVCGRRIFRDRLSLCPVSGGHSAPWTFLSAPPTPAASAPLRRSGGNSSCQRHAYGIALA